MTIAIAVLIITCPCALGLAVPIVHVVAARRLFEAGIMLKDGSALERLVDVDTFVFDKTGTLTLGKMRLANADAINPEHLAIARELAAHSKHPVASALRATKGSNAALSNVAEFPGLGIEGGTGKVLWCLGRASWAAGSSSVSGTVLSRDGDVVERFEFDDRLRQGAAPVIRHLAERGFAVEMLSGDTHAKCALIADQLNIPVWRAELLPQDKVARLEELAASGCKTLMIGDGLNDAPALAAATVSMAPATAADIGRNAADFVFLGESLEAVTLAHSVARRANSLVRQNIWLAIAYNFLAVPIAVAGYVTPLIAAIAMSASSILVVANALRLAGGKNRRVSATSGQEVLA